MKKKLLFLGFMIALFVTIMILPAAAECDICAPTSMVMLDHCNMACKCEYEVCDGCGEKTYRIHCGRTHTYADVSESNPGTVNAYFLRSCKNGCGSSFKAEFDGTIEHVEATRTIQPTCYSMGYTEDYCEAHNGSCYKYLERTSFVDATGHQSSGEGVTIAATCETAGYTMYTCDTCGLEYTADATEPLGHSYTSTVVSEPTYAAVGLKRYTCSTCNHTYDETIPKLCDVCLASQAKVEKNHCEAICECEYTTCPACGQDTLLMYCNQVHYSNSLTKLGAVDSTHYKYQMTCKGCQTLCTFTVYACGGNSSGASTGRAATCTARGFRVTCCNKCFYSESCLSFYINQRKNFTDPKTHSLKTSVVDVTCESDGYTLLSCENCDLSVQSDIVEASGSHQYTSVVTPPTCTQAGFTTYTCTECNDSYTGDPVAAVGHTPKDTGIITAPTCTVAGYTTHVCSVCSVTYTANETAALGHSYQSAVTAPTCTAAGYTKHTCSRCNDSYTDSQKAALGHKNTTKTITAATCTVAGTAKTTCSVCGYSTTASIPATGHSYKSTVVVPDCTEGGYTKYVCSTCKDSYNGDAVPAAGHQYQDVVIAPTCLKDGYTRHVCTVCDHQYTDTLVQSTGHSYEETVSAPTCTVRGYTDHVCSGCGDSYRDTFVAALGHAEELEGSNYVCSVCGNVRTLTTGLRAVGAVVNAFQRLGNGFAVGFAGLFDGLITKDGELTAVASTAFTLAGFALIGVIVYGLIRKFGKRI